MEESPISGRHVPLSWKPGPYADKRYCNTSTALSFVWFIVLDKESGKGIEVVIPNSIAMAVIGSDAGIMPPETEPVNQWAVFAREHEGRDLMVSPEVFRQLESRDISRIPIPPDLTGAGDLTRDRFVQMYFETSPLGRRIPGKYHFAHNEALIFIRFCIIHDLDVRTDCETGGLYLNMP